MATNTLLLIVGGFLGICGLYYFIRKRPNKKTPILTEETKPKKTIVIEPTETPITPWENFDKDTPAKDCIINNINLFAPLIRELHKGMNSDAWIDAIISLKNYQLIEYWNKIKNNANAWETILQMWGIKCESCISFVGMDVYKEMYDTDNGCTLENGVKYEVISQCWVLTRHSNSGKSEKTVICKGLVKKL